MRVQNVKNTIVDTLLDIVAPHHCCGCGEIGHGICKGCINNIIETPFLYCAACTQLPAGVSGICSTCRPPYKRIWVGGERVDTLDTAIDRYKFAAARGMLASLVNVVDARLPSLPKEIVFVPIPTISKHVRERGFDHAVLLAKELGERRKLAVATSLLRRRTNTVQREATARRRKLQAKEAFRVQGKVDDTAIYVLVDDVMTTGATLHYGAKTLRDAGAQEVWAVVVARQVLKQGKIKR